MTSSNTDVSAFLQAVFPDFVSHAIFSDLVPGGGMHHVRRLDGLDGTRDCYWSIAAFPDDGSAVRRVDRALEVRAFVADDVGTKVPEGAVLLALGEPTAIIESSAGNYQFVYRLSQPVPVADWRAFALELERMIGHKLDAGATDPVHVFRLPMGVNTKPDRGLFPVKLLTCDKDAELDVSKVPFGPVANNTGAKPGASVGSLSPTPSGPRVHDIKRLVALIPNDVLYDEWIAIGQRIVSLALDPEAAREAFFEFSARSTVRPSNEATTEQKWRTLKPDRTSGLVLLEMAEAADPEGYRAFWNAEAGLSFDDGVAPPDSGGTVKFTVDEQSSARRVITFLGGTLKKINDSDWRHFDPASGRWERHTGNHMLRVVEELCHEYLNTVPFPQAPAGVVLDDTAKKELVKKQKAAAALRTKMSSKRFLSAVAGLATVNAALDAVEGDFDKGPLLLGVPSGVIDLANGAPRTVRPGARGEMVSKTTAVDPAPPGTPHPLWSKFLGEFTQVEVEDPVTGDVRMVADAALEEWLQVYAGYCLTGLTREHMMPFFLGASGGNGKSTFVNTLVNLWGEYAGPVDKRLLFEKSGMGHMAPLADTAGRRLGSLLDVSPEALWDVQMLKQLTGGDIVKADHKYGAPFAFRAIMKLMVSGQQTPGVRAMDGGLKRRLKVVPLNFKPDAAAMNKDLEAAFEAEWPAILGWALAGLDLYWGLGGLPAAGAIDAETKSYLDDQDVLGAWIAECWTETAGAPNKAMTDLFREFDTFRCGRNKPWAAPNNAVHLGKALRVRGIRVGRDKHGAVVSGYTTKGETPF